ncbi:MAG: dephospho-CoA kinase [Deferrisomatales bacterium]
MSPGGRRRSPGGPPRLLGLTGGIATGKSTAARCFAREGARIVDADRVAREVVAPGSPALQEIRRTFGPEVIRPDGTLDRPALARRVFGDRRARARLNAIVHPRVAQEVDRQIEAAFREDPDGLVVYDVPLLFEGGLEGRCDLVVVVYVPRDEQKRRLMARDGLSPEEADARLASQMDIEEKARRADVVLDNRGSVEDLHRQIRELLRRLRRSWETGA